MARKSKPDRSFTQVHEWLSSNPDVRTDHWLYCWLERRCGERGWWYGSQAEIAEAFGVSTKTVARSLSALRRVRAVSWQRRRSGRFGNGWAIYRVATEKPGDWVDWPDPRAALTDRFVPSKRTDLSAPDGTDLSAPSLRAHVPENHPEKEPLPNGRESFAQRATLQSNGPAAPDVSARKDQRHIDCDCEIAQGINSRYGEWKKIGNYDRYDSDFTERILAIFDLDGSAGFNHDEAEEKVPVLTAATQMIERGDDLVKVGRYVHARLCPRRGS